MKPRCPCGRCNDAEHDDDDWQRAAPADRIRLSALDFAVIDRSDLEVEARRLLEQDDADRAEEWAEDYRREYGGS
jgi:hypothetical protein